MENSFSGYIYKITCLPNGKIYIGQTAKTIEHRWKNHCGVALRHSDNAYLHKAIRKYGPENFTVEEVASYMAETKKELKVLLDEAEKKYIQEFDSFKNGYNLTLGGEGVGDFQFSEESKRKMSESAKLRCTPEFRRKKSEAMKRIKANPEIEAKRKAAVHKWLTSDENRKAVSKRTKGVKFSEEHKKNLSKALSGEHNPMYGRVSLKSLETNSKPVEQLNDRFEVVCVYSSITDVKRRLGGSKKALKKAIKNNTKIHESYWRFQAK